MKEYLSTKWQESPLTFSSLDMLHKDSQLGPAQGRAAAIAAKKQKARQNRDARKERAREAAAAEAARAAKEQAVRVAKEAREREEREGTGGTGRGGGGGGGGNDFDAAVARALAAALASAGLPTPPPAHGHLSPVRAAKLPDTPPSIVLLKRQIKGLKAAGMVGGVDAVQRRADAIMLVELEDDLARREAKRARYGR